MSDDYQRIEVTTGTARRRRWTTEQTLRIIEASYAPGESVSSVARRHGVAPRSVGSIGPHPPIALVEQALAQTTALIGSRICGRPSADEAETAIDRNMVLIAK
jgi:hypothetical protein